MKSHGFTLVEIMIVIAIIGLLGAALYPQLGNYFDRARISDAKAKMRTIQQAALDAQLSTDKPLRLITGTNCSECTCRPTTFSGYAGSVTGSLRELGDDHSCVVRWKTSIERIMQASGNGSGSAIPLYRDGWNVPFMLDENEGEHSGCDRLRSTFGRTRLYEVGIYSIPLQTISGNPCI